jgi:diguanylate cyclase (GGDEF)-like protein
VELSVSDTGSGIAEKDIPKVFSKFPRFAKEIIDDKGYRGTGLGLAIVKELIEMHGGSIKVESKLNKGSTFSISFPKVDAEYVFKEYINHGISVAVENQFPLSVLVIRIDSFDQLRKKFGEAGARNLLGGIERVIQGCLRRKADTVVTDSGELLVLLFDTKREEIASVRGRIERAMSLYIASKEGRPLHGIGISLGNATYPEDASSDNILLYKARMINEENDIDKQKNSQ